MTPIKHKVFYEKKCGYLEDHFLKRGNRFNRVLGAHEIEEGVSDHDNGEDEEKVV